jgi:hypothetical protein
VANEKHNPLFVDHFREYVEKKLGESFDALSDVQRSKHMGRFFAERIRWRRSRTESMIRGRLSKNMLPTADSVKSNSIA